MPQILFKVNKETSLDDLWALFEEAIELVGTTRWAWHRRAKPSLENAIADFRKFREGALDTDLGSKRHFKNLTKLAEEVGDMNDPQSAAVLAVAEIAHAAAHLGHLNTALSRGQRTAADRKYVDLQRAYVNFGLRGVRLYVEMVGTAPTKKYSGIPGWSDK